MLWIVWHAGSIVFLELRMVERWWRNMMTRLMSYWWESGSLTHYRFHVWSTSQHWSSRFLPSSGTKNGTTRTVKAEESYMQALKCQLENVFLKPNETSRFYKIIFRQLDSWSFLLPHSGWESRRKLGRQAKENVYSLDEDNPFGSLFLPIELWALGRWLGLWSWTGGIGNEMEILPKRNDGFIEK